MAAHAALFATALGCATGDATERPPLADRPRVPAPSDTAEAPLILIAGPARAALDSANALFKAKRYSHALSLYRSAARLAPTEPAPLLGMLMVATVLEDARLADSVRAALRTDIARTPTSPPKG